jgi:F-type H+-transporting ATPase subunit b
MSDVSYYAPYVNFLVVMAILIYFGRKPLADMLVARSSDIAKAIRGAEAEASEANAALKVWESKWSSSAAEAKQNLEDTHKRAATLRESTLANARKQATRIVQEAGLVGQTEANKGRETLQKEIVRKSITMANDFLSAHVGEKDRHQLVTEYVELLGNGSTR